MDGLAEDDFGLAAAKTKPILPFGELAFNAGRTDLELVGAGEGVFGVEGVGDGAGDQFTVGVGDACLI